MKLQFYQKKEKYEARYLTEKEQKMFLESARGYAHEDIFLANLAIGCCIGELLSLKWSDIDFENKTIHIQRTIHYAKVKKEESCHFFFTTTKTECSDRIIPLLPEMEEILKRVKRKELNMSNLIDVLSFFSFEKGMKKEPNLRL